MQVNIYSVNENGLQQIADFLAENHKKGAKYFTRDVLRAWAADAEFSLAEGNDAAIEIKSWDSIHGYTQTFTISDEGVDIELIELEEDEIN